MANFCAHCGASLAPAAPRGGSTPSKAVRKAPRAKNPALGRAMKKAYSRSHTKAGRFRKGWDRSRMLKYAHKIKK